MSKYPWSASKTSRMYSLGTYECTKGHEPPVSLSQYDSKCYVSRYYIIRKLIDGRYLPTLQEWDIWGDGAVIVWGTGPKRLLRDAVAACDEHARETGIEL